MASIKCGDCGRIVSTNDRRCCHCGYMTNQKCTACEKWDSDYDKCDVAGYRDGITACPGFCEYDYMTDD